VKGWLRGIGVAVAALIIVLAAPGGAEAQAVKGNAPTYLALGDSYVYGSYCVGTSCQLATDFQSLEDVRTDNWFVGYPVYVQAIIDRPLVNAGCPGETTESFLGDAQASGCQRVKDAGLLHVPASVYPAREAQIDFAERYLGSHDRVQLVTVQLGGNDTQQLIDSCKGSGRCIMAGLPAFLEGLAARFDMVLGRIRDTGYAGPIIAVEYPATDYNSAVAAITQQVQAAMHSVAANHEAVFAPVFERFRLETLPFHGNACSAGLLITKADGSCNIHPTAAGHQLIARVIAETLAAQGER
jgi:lysophospholipase L1-like esterase